MDGDLQGLGSLLPRDAWNALQRNGAYRRYDAGETLLRQGEDGTHVLVLTSGQVKIIRVEPDGSELLLAIRSPGEVLGEIAVLGGTTRSATVTALDPCLTYALAAVKFRRIIDDFRLHGLLFGYFLTRLREAEDIRAELAELAASQRVARTLVRFAAMTAPPRAEGTAVDIRLSQDELASAVGLSRSAVAAELADLRRRGLVSTARRRVIILDLDGLRALADG
jgi:CRP-like cAMP-binding protein